MTIHFALIALCSPLAFVASDLEYRSDETALLQHISHRRGRIEPIDASNFSHLRISQLENTVVVPIKDTRARCYNGATPMIAITEWSTASKDNWMFHLKGGGLCATKSECKSCAEINVFMTWDYVSQNPADGTAGLAGWIEGDDFRHDSRFADYNHVYFPYCSCDMWTGTANNSTDHSLGFIFGGHNIFTSGVKYLVDHGYLATATNIIFQGKSSGGFGVFVNVGWLQDEFPHVKVTALPVAGHWPAAVQYEGPHKNYNQRTNMSLENAENLVKIWSSFLPENCTAALKDDNPAHCLYIDISSKYVTIPKFLVQAQTDSGMTVGHCGISHYHKYFGYEPQISFLRQWQENQSQQFKVNLRDRDGWFNPACFMHGSFSAELPLIQNMNYVDAFAQWYFESKEVRMQDYGEPFSGTCPDPTSEDGTAITWPSWPN